MNNEAVDHHVVAGLNKGACGNVSALKQGRLTTAKDFLRHADIGIGAGHYTHRPRQATSRLGALLKAVDDEKIIALEQEPRNTVAVASEEQNEHKGED